MQPKKRILCVEDDADTALMLIHLLRRAGYDVQSVATAAGALSLALSFDLYLLDYRLPDGNGIDLCHTLRAQHRHTPIVIYSANAYQAQHRAARAAGATAYVNKPEIDILLATIKNLLPT